jgi:hypothetical protein
MARAPRAKVPKTSGAGVSRLSYQQGYAKGNRGTSAAGGAVPGVDKAAMDEVKLSRGRAKGGGRSINVSYGETLPVGDLKDIKALGELKAPARDNYVKDRSRTSPVAVKDKGRSAYAKK